MRALITVILIIGVFIAPWWVMIFALLASVVLYRRFFLALIPAIVMDLMHGGAHLIAEPFSSATLIIGIVIILLIWIENYLRDNVRI
ncbi:MAG: hypothetical protein KBD16_01700 [Candidatus Pacebacteria bacterium]|nr:hypothetical protein [Candidatus Paceibacterota bacterium]